MKKYKIPWHFSDSSPLDRPIELKDLKPLADLVEQEIITEDILKEDFVINMTKVAWRLSNVPKVHMSSLENNSTDIAKDKKDAEETTREG